MNSFMLTGSETPSNLGHNIRLLSGDDETDLQALCERCSDFSELAEGRPPEKDAGHSILFDLPPEKTLKDKFVFGVYKETGVLIQVKGEMAWEGFRKMRPGIKNWSNRVESQRI